MTTTQETHETQATQAEELAELSFLQEMVELAVSAATWDELMRTVVDRSTAAMDSQVCSLYLLDRDESGLTLAATNGVDRQHIGVARLDVGQGITGIAAAERRPVVSVDLNNDPRCAWIRGVDHRRFSSMVAVPLIWHDTVIGVLNIKTVERRDFTEREIRRLSTIAALLAGIIERGRLQLEAEAQRDSLRAIDQARAELIAVVTHQLRTPLSVVRAYLDLLGAVAHGEVDGAQAAEWHAAAIGQVEQLDGLVGSVLDNVRAGHGLPMSLEAFDVGGVVDELLTRLAPLLRRHVLERYPQGAGLAQGDSARFRQVLELLLENAAKYAPDGGHIVVADWTQDGEVRVCVHDDGPGVPAAERESVFEPFVRLHPGQQPGSGIGLFAARRLMAGMGGRLWIEDTPHGGSQFVAALPLA